MQILVVVANIQMRTLKTDLGKGSMKIAISHGLIGPKPKADAESISMSHASWRKGMWLTFRNLSWIFSGNANDPADIGKSHWKSSLFFLTGYGPGIELVRDRAVCQEEQFTIRAVNGAFNDH